MKTLVITPTYNEAENIVDFIKVVLEAAPVNILIVDDNSPDMTAKKITDHRSQIVDGNRINLIERAGKLGLGTAYMEGFRWAMEHGYDYIISMDADFSHDPKFLPDMLAVNENTDIVIGSRYIKGGKIEGWGIGRYLNSYFANFITRLALGLKPKDATAGFKRYSARFVTYLLSKNLISPGYAFQVETLFWAKAGKFKVSEIPITFVDRRVGQSKISGEIKRSFKVIWRLFVRRKIVREFAKFILVGGFNTLLDWLIFFVIIGLTGWNSQLLKQCAKAISFIFSASSSYIMNRKFTFRSTDSQVAQQVAKFLLVAVVGLIINNISFYIANGVLGYSNIISLATATLVAMMWNFTLNKKWTFRN